MKKTFFMGFKALCVSALAFTAVSCYDDSGLLEKIEGLDNRLTKVEQTLNVEVATLNSKFEGLEAAYKLADKGFATSLQSLTASLDALDGKVDGVVSTHATDKAALLAEIENLKAELEAMTGAPVAVNVVEVKPVDMDAQLVAESIAAQLERRISFRRAMKQAIGRTMRLGARGIKISVSGRLAGAEIARTEHYHEGTIPLQTIRADIDYGFWEANTTYGKIGVKVWIYKGEVLSEVARTGKNDDRRQNRRDGRGQRRDGRREGGRDGERREGRGRGGRGPRDARNNAGAPRAPRAPRNEVKEATTDVNA